MKRRGRWRIAAGALGGSLGLAAGAGLVVGTSSAVVRRPAAAPPRLEATHLPPLLTAPGEDVTLRYDAYCVGADEPTARCEVSGSVFVRGGGTGPFRALPLELDSSAASGRYAARVPESLARSGFVYYAVLRNVRTGVSVTVPAAAPDVVERSVPLGRATVVDLGRHAFGATRRADARVVRAQWGDGAEDVGLEERGPDATAIGASAFDVDAAGRVTVLDEAHRRLLRWTPGQALPESTPVAVNGTIADLAVGDDDTSYVLESAGHGGRAVLRAFTASGEERPAIELEEAAAAVRNSEAGPLVLEPQSGRWLPSRGAGDVGRPSALGLRTVVYRPEAGEVRFALVSSGGVAARGWMIRSRTPIAEVQLAEPLGERLVAVVRLYEEARAEFVVLVLGPNGIERSFSLDASDWAEAAPLGRFRLAGRALYRLGSTPAGIYVDRYDLGVS